ncbi:MAG TPA: nuclear transport factor 2 family protein [Burkholderiales bacterium]|nr:nuclear transport factor 2 family protein [Burkholderiales bacterium]
MTKAVNETQIRELIDDWGKALRAKDVDALMSHYAPDMLLFDLAPPLRYVGADAYRKSWEDWFATIQGSVGSEHRDLSITAGEDVAFCHGLHRISGKKTNGEQFATWVRVTVCYRKIDGEWMVVHEHVSVPFYMDGSYRAAVDLEP